MSEAKRIIKLTTERMNESEIESYVINAIVDALNNSRDGGLSFTARSAANSQIRIRIEDDEGEHLGDKLLTIK